jgi:lipid-A-disaccharide synthase-like uncharacterized protein
MTRLLWLGDGIISNSLRYGYQWLGNWIVINDSANGSCAVIFWEMVIGGDLWDYYLRRDDAVLASTHLKLWLRSKNNMGRYIKIQSTSTYTYTCDYERASYKSRSRSHGSHDPSGTSEARTASGIDKHAVQQITHENYSGYSLMLPVTIAER